jgi:hypothetical protein
LGLKLRVEYNGWIIEPKPSHAEIMRSLRLAQMMCDVRDIGGGDGPDIQPSPPRLAFLNFGF